MAHALCGTAALALSAAPAAADDAQRPASSASASQGASATGSGGSAPAAKAAPTLNLVGHYGEGQGVEADDGSFGLKLRVRGQVRTTVVVPEEESADPSADFQMRRLRVAFDGHAFGQLVTWRVQLAFAPLDVDPVAPLPLRDAFFTVSPLRDIKIRAGQMKVPYGRQRVVSSGNLQMVDRSVATSELNLDRDVGVQLFSEDLGGLGGKLGYHLGVFGGDGRNRVSGGYGLLYAARLVYRPLGGERMKDDLDEVDFERGRPRLQVAVSGAFNHQTDRDRSSIGPVFRTGPWVDYAHLGADVTLKSRGITVAGEFFLRDAIHERRSVEQDGAVVTDVARSGFGQYLQVGYLFPNQLELSGRVGALRPLGERDNPLAPTKEAGGGVSYYVHQHALKLQADSFYLWDAWGEGQVQTRLQLQFTN